MGIPDWPLSSSHDGSKTYSAEAHIMDYGDLYCLVGIKGHVNNDDNGSMSALGFIFREFPDYFPSVKEHALKLSVASAALLFTIS